ELYLGGESLAKGYYGQPEQTAERWIEHPQWGRLYRTGDRVRYRWDGELEFLGRFDHQISLRGFRIELGEIEACLLRHPQIQEAVVEVWEERLVAYLVGDTVEGEAMRQWVKQRLPEYMVPRFYEWLPALPITPNGKVDRKALPEPAWEGEVTFVAARNEIEARLVHIWQEILQQPQIGIQDNFFACGGDSILSIQVVARAQREGLRLTPKQLFEHQTIAELAPYVQQQPQVAAEQGLVEGTVPFSPIQQWFWEQAIPNRNHWNQSLLLLWKETAIPDALQAALQAVIEQHDALRLRIVEEESVHQSIEAELPFTWVDLRGQPEEWQQQRIEQIADQAQQQLDLTKGPIQRMIYFQLGDQPDRLLWILHHWMVDAVSWRILLEDFQQAYQQATQQQPIQLPAKTSSWKDWIAQLQQYAQTQQVQKELPYWKQQVESITALPVDHPEGENRQAHLQMKVRTFTKEQTEALLRESTKAYRTQVTDLLLTAWAQTVQKWTASDICHLHLEGHGREEISEQLDLSRTVGWFTSLYPLKLDISEAETMGDAIKGVKEQIRAIPHKGLGYGLLQTWGKESSLTTAPKPEVSFNYLGQVDGTWSGDLLLGMAPEARGEMVDPTSERAHRIDLLGMVVAGRFQLTLQYSEQQYEQQTMDWLIQTYMEQLQQLITHCCS
ncbi:non-ribosomal peptide synthase domain TIGR01720, partial [Seinonella peptonophila]